MTFTRQRTPAESIDSTSMAPDESRPDFPVRKEVDCLDLVFPYRTMQGDWGETEGRRSQSAASQCSTTLILETERAYEGPSTGDGPRGNRRNNSRTGAVRLSGRPDPEMRDRRLPRCDLETA